MKLQPLFSKNFSAFLRLFPFFQFAPYVYGKKHDWWDVAAGAVIGAGSAYIFTRPFAKKHNLSISPVAGDGHYGIYASMTF